MIEGVPFGVGQLKEEREINPKVKLPTVASAVQGWSLIRCTRFWRKQR